jgi:hypothetical protein
LHTLAEWVLAPARQRVDGHIGLRPTPGGFGTPEFGAGEQVRVEGTRLLHRVGEDEQSLAITTVRDAAEFVDLAPCTATDVYAPQTACDPDNVLVVDPDAAAGIATWYAFGEEQLEQLCAQLPHPPPAPVQLWPEHFDLATAAGDEARGMRANFGASPGDAAIPEPYLYVGPWDRARSRRGLLAAYPFGAALRYGELLAAPDAPAAAREFFDACTQLLAATGG